MRADVEAQLDIIEAALVAMRDARDRFVRLVSAAGTQWQRTIERQLGGRLVQHDRTSDIAHALSRAKLDERILARMHGLGLSALAARGSSAAGAEWVDDLRAFITQFVPVEADQSAEEKESA